MCRVSEMLDYTAEDLTGRSMYSLCHASDVDKIRQTHTDRKSIFIPDCQRTKGEILLNFGQGKSYGVRTHTGKFTNSKQQ
jgi:hypothetical protein